MHKIKEKLKSTLLYRKVYLKIVGRQRRNKRKLRGKISSFNGKVKRYLKTKYNLAYRHYILTYLYPGVYKKYSKLPIDENKIVLVEIRLPYLSNSFQLLYDKLYRETEFDLHCHFLRVGFASKKELRGRAKAYIKDIATAKYIFMSDSTNIDGRIKFRDETVVTQLWHGCGAFKKFGFSTADSIFGASRSEMINYPFHTHYTHATVSSPEVQWAFEEAMRYSRESGVVKPLGSSRTDIFYDEEFIEGAKAELYEKFPAAKGKKVILYAPTFRGRVAKAKTPNVLRIREMYDAFGDEYVLIFKHHPLVQKRPGIPPELQDNFAIDMTGDMSIESLLCVSDICISDYSSLIFEYSLFERPMIFLAHDIDEYFDWRGFYYDYDELTPGPVFVNTAQIIDYIVNIDERFDVQVVKDFRKKFMSSCDGHATERIINTAIGTEAYSKAKRKEPLPKAPYHEEPKADDFYKDNQ